jgi:hypothetical protein
MVSRVSKTALTTSRGLIASIDLNTVLVLLGHFRDLIETNRGGGPATLSLQFLLVTSPLTSFQSSARGYTDIT